MTDAEARQIFRRWVAEYYEVPLREVDALPRDVYESMSAVVLEDMERRTGVLTPDDSRLGDE